MCIIYYSYDFVYLNDSLFTVGEEVEFRESAIKTILQGVDVGNFTNRTNNYSLLKGHKDQYCDYSQIIRKEKSAIPSKKLLVIFDSFKVASGNAGDLFTVNSYTEERYSKDIPILNSGVSASDILDFRPRVNPFNPETNISYDLPEDSFVSVSVYDMRGTLIKTLVNDVQSSGYKTLKWNGTNDKGQKVSAGLYLYRIEAEGFTDTKKMALLK